LGISSRKIVLVSMKESLRPVLIKDPQAAHLPGQRATVGEKDAMTVQDEEEKLQSSSAQTTTLKRSRCQGIPGVIQEKSIEAKTDKEGGGPL